MVNVSALPDKGERLKSQVKDLEEALEALSLTSVALTGEILTCNVQMGSFVPVEGRFTENAYKVFLSDYLSCDETWAGSGLFQDDSHSVCGTREVAEWFECRNESYIICTMAFSH